MRWKWYYTFSSDAQKLTFWEIFFLKKYPNISGLYKQEGHRKKEMTLPILNQMPACRIIAAQPVGTETHSNDISFYYGLLCQMTLLYCRIQVSSSQCINMFTCILPCSCCKQVKHLLSLIEIESVTLSPPTSTPSDCWCKWATSFMWCSWSACLVKSRLT